MEYPEVVHSGYLTIANRSLSKLNTITLADASDASIVVPGAGADLSSTSFTAQTFSARAECRTLNRDCERSSMGQTLNCTQAGYPGLPYFSPSVANTPRDVHSFALVSLMDNREVHRRWIFQAGTAAVYLTNHANRYGVQDLSDHGRTANPVELPVELAIQMRWSTYRNVGMDKLEVAQADGRVDIVPPPWITLYAGCNVTFSNLTVQYAPMENSWKILLEEQSSDSFTSVMWAPTV
ncbi:hypothetical protein FRC01_009023 [Tulasnella sp. 417]|nr:hypothetical protein FRC01_009023 [Tulasnella sp. 417]